MVGVLTHLDLNKEYSRVVRSLLGLSLYPLRRGFGECNNPVIKGIKVNNTESKISQYADDTSLFLDGSRKTLQSALKSFNEFALIAFGSFYEQRSN